MIKTAHLAALVGLIALGLATASAQILSGAVTNGTTNKPAAGDAIELINIANGMDVAANTKADSAGKFSFTLSGPPGPHLVRATHQGVTYFQFAPPGTSSVELKVYDVAKKIGGLSLTADVMRFQADANSLQGIRLFAVNNESSPPVTQMNDHNFEFYLPAGAKVEQVQAKAPNGQPIPAEAIPQAEKNRYAINFPLRPGETQIQLEFTLPYNGTAKFDPKPLYPAAHFVVIVPQTMRFTAADSSSFKSMPDPTQPDSVVELAQQIHVGQQLGFTVSGTGTISDQPPQAASGAMGGGAQEQSQAAPDNRPGGGLGAPIDAPDPLEKYRWPIIGAFLVLLAIGGWIVTKRQGAVSAASAGAAGGSASGSSVSGKRGSFAAGPLVAPITRPGAAAVSGSSASPSGPNASAPSSAANAQLTAGAVPKSARLLEALKEELFQLEVERKQGKITQAEYEKAKAALDQTLERALKRNQT